MVSTPLLFQVGTLLSRPTANKNGHPILGDPDVLSLERLLRVKSKVELRLPGRLLDPPPVSVPLNQAGGCSSLLACQLELNDGVPVATLPAAHVTAGERRGSLDCLRLTLSLQRLRLQVKAKESHGLLEVSSAG